MSLRLCFKTIAALSVTALTAYSSLASAQTFHYHGRLLDPDGIPVNAANVQFKVEIRSPGIEDCLLYSETHTRNLIGSDGYFSLSMNDFVRPPTVPNTEPFSLADVFQKASFTLAVGKCAMGTSYVPLAGEGRRWVLSFNDGTGWDQFPSEMIDRVPLAISAMAVGEFKSDNLLRVVDGSGVPASATPLTTAMYAELTALINGTTTQYIKSSPGGGATLPSYGAPPVAPSPGQIWYDSGSQDVKLRTSSGTITLGAGGGGSGTVTQITAAGGLEGGTITTTGTIRLATTGVASGTYAKVQVDDKGRVLAGFPLASTDIPGLSATHITAGTLSIARGGTGIGAAPLNGQLLIGNGTDYSLSTLTGGTGISISNAAGAITINATGGSGSVTNVTAGAGLTGGPITTTGTLSLATSGVNSGAYAKITVDQYGRATSGSTLNVTDIPNLNADKITSGTLNLSRLPSTVVYNDGNVAIAGSFLAGDDATCASGKYGAIRVNSNNLQVCLATNTWTTLSTGAASGTVTSIVAGAGLAGGTVTTTGTLALATTGIAPGTYTKLTIDTYGRATAGSTLAATDIPNLDAAKITTGTFTSARLPSSVILDGGNSTAAAVVIGANNNQQLQLKTNNTTQVTIGTNGNVGIGTTNPQHNLHVEGANADAKIAVMNTSSTAARYPAMEVINYSGGFAGVPRFAGTTYRGNSSTPTAVQSGDALASLEGAGARDTAWNTNTTAQILMSATQTYSASNGGSAISFKTTPNNSVTMADRMIIGQDGNVGIGTTTPNSRLEVAGAVQPGNDAASCVTAKNGAIRFNGGNLQVCLTTTWTTLSTSAGNGTVTSIVAGTGLTGGTITTTGTLALATTGVTAAAYPKVTVDVYGRVVTGSTLAATDIPSLDAGKINSGTLAVARIPELDASKITTGTIDPSRLPTDVVLNGGNVTSGTMSIGTSNINSLNFQTSGASRVTILSSGTIGIGTSSPMSMLHMPSGDMRLGEDQRVIFGSSPNLGSTGFAGRGGVSGSYLNMFSFGNIRTFVDTDGNTDNSFEIYGNTAETTNPVATPLFSVTDQGYVGIGVGTQSRIVRLHVSGGILAGDDATCAAGKYGAIRVNSNNLQVCLPSNSWSNLAASGATGTVTQVTAGAGLDGGTITTAGTIALATTGIAAGTYTKITVDGYGRATAGSTLAASDIPDLDGTKITSGTLAVARIPDLGGSKIVSGTLAVARLPSTVIYNGGNTAGDSLSIGTNDDQSLLLKTNNTTRVTIGTNGNVGIGTTSPTAFLEVTSTSGVSANLLTLSNQHSGTNGPAARLALSTGSTDKALITGGVDGSTTQGYFAVHTRQSGSMVETLRINSTGNVGIGTITPQTKLHVTGAILPGDDPTCATGKYGAIRVNSTNLQVCLPSNSWSNLAASGATGTVTQVTAGAGLDGGTITTTGTISLATTGIGAGVYAKTTVDIYGRATAGSTLAASDIPDLDGSKITTGTLASARLPSNLILDGGNSTGSTLFVGTNDNQTLQLETNNTTRITVGTNGSVGIGTTLPNTKLHVIGSILPGIDADPCASAKWGAIRVSSGVLQVCTTANAWTNLVASGSVGTVTSITVGTGLTGGTITTNGTIELAATGIGAGTYTKLSIDAYGRAIASSTLNATDIPGLDAMKIVSGTFPSSRLPSSVVLDGGNSLSTGTMSIGSNSNHPLKLKVNGADLVYLSTTGKTGFGTPSPLRKLHVDAVGSGEPAARFSRDLGSTTANIPVLEIERSHSLAANKGFGASINFYLGNHSPGTTELAGYISTAWENNRTDNINGEKNASTSLYQVNNGTYTEALKISGTGSLFIHPTSLDNASAKLHVNNASTSSTYTDVLITHQASGILSSDGFKIALSGPNASLVNQEAGDISIQTGNTGSIYVSSGTNGAVKINNVPFARVKTISHSGTTLTADFSDASAIKVASTSVACGTISVAGVQDGGTYKLTLPNVTSACAIQMNGSTAMVKAPSGTPATPGVMYDLYYDGTHLWVKRETY